ncbi:MAG: YncE family protein [Acidobacteria bacterium]|jgi:YVTN family beta-propeller protein|nr:YncE family protein [Acidobacteriota bacterium]
MKSALRIFWGFLVFVCAGSTVSARAAIQYHLIKKVVLGGEGFWDYLKLDSAHHRLFISRGTHVMVVDTRTYKVIGNIPDTQGVHGIALAPELNRGFTSDGGANQVTIFNLKTLKVIGTANTTGRGPDCIVYDPASKRVFTFNGRSDSSTAIDAATGKVVGTIALGGRPEFAVADGEGHIYNNLEDKSEELEIDSHSLKILHRWPLAPGEHPSGLAMDTKSRRLFAGCHNQMMVIMNANNGHVLATEPIGRGVDACRFDPGARHAFSSNGMDGTLTVVREDSPNRFHVVAQVPTERGARTMALDPRTHRIYLVTARFGPLQPLRPGQRFRRPTLIPGSFTLLVFGP